jgi:hypothetical protein
MAENKTKPTEVSVAAFIEAIADEADHKDLREMRDANFVLIKVNMSAINENSLFLSRYPKIPGYPWLFVLDTDGRLLKSEDTNELEGGVNGYSARSIRDFLWQWKAQ